MSKKSPSICVFCGSAKGTKPIFAETAKQLGQALAKASMPLVYGGGHVGMMGLLAESSLSEGGTVIGIIPEFLERREVAYRELSELVVVESMHVRKEMMYDRSDAFVVLPGGYGTLDETLEILTWRQLGQHRKPIFVLNVEDYWTPLLSLLDHIVDHGFAQRDTSGFVEPAADVASLMTRLHSL